jgi:hypothetical protein
LLKTLSLIAQTPRLEDSKTETEKQE